MGANDKVAATFYDPASGESEYVPTVEFARGAYIYDRTTLGVVTAKQAQAEFNRMIAKVRAEAKAEALNDVADQMRDRFTASWIRGKAREYTHGPHKPVGAFSIPENKEKTP